MIPLLMAVPMLLVVIALGYVVLRTLARAWVDYRVKLALLEKLERRPELADSFEEFQSLLEGSPEQRRRPDFVVTGAILAGIGVVCAIAAQQIGSGHWAVGAYLGGVACVVLGFLLALLGVVVRGVRGK